ncbi:MAG TPA: sulfatase-like hydrolase/transferase [Planctomycetota bacterium]|nr:sulfatase-like hydrolase/transferase [Planctomycetota bacterium]
MMSRREFLEAAGAGVALLPLAPRAHAREGVAERPSTPNVVLVMADDLGWGDVGFNGSKVVHTPHLDRLAAEGLRFTRFYAHAPVCSPTRGSCLTGRHPYRYGITFANVGHLPKQEFTLAEALKTLGYTTGHFGKWHLGTLTKTVRDGNRGGRGDAAYAPPWDHGFDVCFSTESKVPTWNPMLVPGSADKPYGTRYWTGPETPATENLEGDDSRVIADRVVPFVRDAVRAGKPFLAVVWFHTPHLPVLSSGKYLEMYKDKPPQQAHYYGAITAMDEQVGRLRDELRALGVANDTMLWFASDNGPEVGTPGSPGPFRGRKRSLYEGGVREPAFLVWPARVRQARSVDVPCCTSDYLPTVLAALGFERKGQPEPLDGVSLLPLVDGAMAERPRPIAFESGGQLALSDNRFKLYSPAPRGGRKGREQGAEQRTWELYDLVADPAETKDLAAQQPQVVERMRQTLDQWRASCRSSLAGDDYRRPSPTP